MDPDFDDGFADLKAAIAAGRVIPCPYHASTPRDDWAHFLWDGNRAESLQARRRFEQESGPIEIWSLQDGEGSLLYVEKRTAYVNNLGWFLVREGDRQDN